MFFIFCARRTNLSVNVYECALDFHLNVIVIIWKMFLRAMSFFLWRSAGQIFIAMKLVTIPSRKEWLALCRRWLSVARFDFARLFLFLHDIHLLRNSSMIENSFRCGWNQCQNHEHKLSRYRTFKAFFFDKSLLFWTSILRTVWFNPYLIWNHS